MLELLGAMVWMVLATLLGFKKDDPEAETPKDPLSRAKYYASQCLAFLKNELMNASIVNMDEHRLTYRAPASAEVRTLWVDGGKLMRQVDDARPARMTRLGPEGNLQFALSSPTQLRVNITAAEDTQALHKIVAYLKVTEDAD